MYSQIINKVIENIEVEIKKKSTMNKLSSSIIEPIIQNTLTYIYPYILSFTIIIILIFIIILFILFLNIKVCYYTK